MHAGITRSQAAPAVAKLYHVQVSNHAVEYEGWNYAFVTVSWQAAWGNWLGAETQMHAWT